MEFLSVSLALIHASPTNPRKSFPEAELLELAASIKDHDVLQPILVRPWPAEYAHDGDTAPAYELIAGERRFRASKLAGKEDIPATIRNLSDREVLEIQIIENLQRKGLHELEEADGYSLMIREHGYSADELAERIGKSKAYIYGRLKLTALSMPARLAFRDGQLSASTALLIARIPGETLQSKAIQEITGTWQGVLSYRAAKDHIQRNYCFYLDNAPFPQENLTLNPDAGPCSACPQRSGSNPEAYPDIERADVCTNPECYRVKSAAWLKIEKDRVKETGKKVIEGDEAKGIDPNYSQKYVALDKREYNLPGAPTVREALKAQQIETIFVEDQASGKLVEVIEKKAMTKALEEAGIKIHDHRERERDMERKARAENKFRSRLYQRWHDAMSESLQGEEDPTLETDELRIVAKRAWGWLGSDLSEVVNVMWAPKSEAKEAWDRRHEMNKHVTARLDEMSRKELILFILDCALASDGRCGLHNVDYTPAPLIGLAAPLGIKADDIRAEIAAEEAAKTKKPSKTAPAKSISTPPKAPRGGEGVSVLKYVAGDRVRLANPSDATTERYAGQCGAVRTVAKSMVTGGPVLHITLDDGDEVQAWPSEVEMDETPTEEQPAAPARNLVQYAHPDNKDLCWSGRGRQPKWVEEWLLIEGRTLEQLRVAGAGTENSSAPAGAENETPAAADPFPAGTPVRIVANRNPTLVGKDGKVHDQIHAPDGSVLLFRVKLRGIGALSFKANELEALEAPQSSAGKPANAKPCAAEHIERCNKTLELPLA